MTFRLFWFVVLVPVVAAGQALQDINYSYLYRTSGPFAFRMAPVKTSTMWFVHYELEVSDGAAQASNYAIEWEWRDDLRDKEGDGIRGDSLISVAQNGSGARISGTIEIPLGSVRGVLNAKVTGTTQKQVWNYPLLLPDNYPVDITVTNQDKILTRKYIQAGESLKFRAPDEGKLIVSYYSDEFPAAAPPFSEALARVSGVIATDSIIQISSGQEVNFTKSGLYLVQRDTSSVQGIAFRVYDDYPKYSRLENLVDPLIYVCTRQELDRLKDARGEKRQFDRIILNMTGNTERAKNFMRSYFRRVEDANELFASYKAGWKTDRGMVYIIFGTPDEVYRFEDREVWNYSTGKSKVSLSFVRSGTLFDPDNFVLVRQKKYMLTWYEVVDLWRNSRF